MKTTIPVKHFKQSREDIISDLTFTIGQVYIFRLHNLYTSSNGQYALQINEINDSRCPRGANCVWEGEVTLKGEWTANKNKNIFELHSLTKSSEKQPDGFTIQIIDVKPYPEYGTESKLEELVINMLIMENNK